MDKKIVPLSLFKETAIKNGFEIFTADEIASYYKEGLMKSKSGDLSKEEKDEFCVDIMYLQKAICQDENNQPVTMYYRKKQVEWETTSNGTILKGLEGIYLDTPENRKLNRVGKAYIPTEEFMKAISETEDSILKSISFDEKYGDTEGNRLLGRVGKPLESLKNLK